MDAGNNFPPVIWLVAAGIFIVNIPFGFWRACVKKFSLQWFMAVHIPVPIAIALRLLAGLAWRLVTFPVFVAAFFAGQFLGAKLQTLRARP